MIIPIQALRQGAAQIGSGNLEQRISIKTGDELESLADQFNDMAGRLEESYAGLEQKVEQRSTEIRNLLLFFELEWLKFDDPVADRLLGNERLKGYTHYLRNLRRYRPHTLAEPEEKIVNEKDNTGRNAFGRLFSEITSALLFTLEIDGKQEPHNLSQMLSLLHDPDRTLRQRAMETLYRGLSEQGQVLSFIYDTLIQDHITMDRLRRYADPLAQRHLSNEIDPNAVKIMMEVTEEHYHLAQDYFRLKAKLLGLPRIALYDQYAPLGKEARSFRYAQARELILEAFQSFDPSFRQLAAEFFANSWVDAEVRNGKRGGAFCASPSPKLHPYILCNYDDHLRDAFRCRRGRRSPAVSGRNGAACRCDPGAGWDRGPYSPRSLQQRSGLFCTAQGRSGYFLCYGRMHGYPKSGVRGNRRL